MVKLPARRVGKAVERLLRLYLDHREPGEEALDYFRRVEDSVVKEAVADLTKLDEESATPEDFLDLGQTEEFVVAIGAGECAT